MPKTEKAINTVVIADTLLEPVGVYVYIGLARWLLGAFPGYFVQNK